MADNNLSETLSALFSNPESMNKLQGLIRTLSSGNAASSASSAQSESTNQLQGLINMLSSGNAASSGSSAQPESTNQLQGLISMLSSGNAASSAESETPPSAPPDQPMQSGNEETSNSGGLPFDPSLLLKLQQAMSLVRQDDPRVAFLVALKPNLSEQRRQRVDEAVRMLRLVHLVPFLREQHFL